MDSFCSVVASIEFQSSVPATLCAIADGCTQSQLTQSKFGSAAFRKRPWYTTAWLGVKWLYLEATSRILMSTSRSLSAKKASDSFVLCTRQLTSCCVRGLSMKHRALRPTCAASSVRRGSPTKLTKIRSNDWTISFSTVSNCAPNSLAMPTLSAWLRQASGCERSLAPIMIVSTFHLASKSGTALLSSRRWATSWSRCHEWAKERAALRLSIVG
mmetsp:Transcript_1595/g.3626  ORF Transcript_1595/g.3626 Transcript_1595/m.3626 type:complete len:214 (+) Transcript_1595:428-1069(+)